MAIVRWRPFLGMSQWPNLWDEDLAGLEEQQGPLDVYETEEQVVVRANVAGVREEDIDITFEKGVLWIRAERAEEDKQDKKHYSRSTWNYSYKVAVPGTIDFSSEPEAEVEDGMLTVAFSKSESSKPRKLAVKRKAKK